ncbi:DNA polymerase III subunit delta [uncultured Ilumatobacter sp.]|uniref:DNA polymerase III subunit delta n=1 Tax=uncultured Ilumatobacter sp. TaxID=879968 RepID=UPI00374EC4E0
MATHLLTGDNESILRTAVSDLVHELVGDGERSMMVDEFDGEEYELRLVVDAAQTMPFLTDKRVVIARQVSRFNADDLAPLLAYVENPLDSSDLVLVAGGTGRLSKKLSDAVKAVGKVHNTSPGREKRKWLADQVSAAGLKMDGGATAQLATWLGEDAGRLDGILATLKSTYGAGEKLSFAQIEPFIGEAGGVPPWDLTDAIMDGDTTKALSLLGRMVHAGGRHPLQVMSILHSHYAGIAKLDGVDARNEDQSGAATGLKGFPAKKALQNYNKLGGANTKRAITWIAQADLDLRGAKDLEPELVMEVLIARLSKLR